MGLLAISGGTENKIFRRIFCWIPMIQPLLACVTVAIAINQCALSKTHSVHDKCLNAEGFVILSYTASVIAVLIDASLVGFVVRIIYPRQMSSLVKVKKIVLKGLPVLVPAVITFIKCLHIKLSNEKSADRESPSKGRATYC